MTIDEMKSGILAMHRVLTYSFGQPQPATWSYHAADCRPRLRHPCL